ncbi:hypothetical protein GOP47_0025804 [Adiantum capillus-veneris]|uniref:Uncharacterized protein n=1 Tax=Adiantum capillus-veneris TaxID=13818 RepID=A0A9D4Z380_ADICA|nr:hypothetical protein GOP47_0025804 [Adiantum capillus-veneris]
MGRRGSWALGSTTEGEKVSTLVVVEYVLCVWASKWQVAMVGLHNLVVLSCNVFAQVPGDSQEKTMFDYKGEGLVRSQAECCRLGSEINKR